jgi:hypothetical protein
MGLLSHGEHSNRPMPTRVIDCSNYRPVLSGDMQHPWISLSHCWGIKGGLKTTRSNYNSMLDAIELGQLPATIRDAIIFTRRLGFQYLWVDSICIVQPERNGDVDDENDWIEELPNMHQYYKESAATLIVELAAGDEDGFLDVLRLGGGRKITPQPVSIPGEVDGKNFVFRFAVDPHITEREALHAFLARDTPHRQRAWTLQ